jgi:hypothetical protein
METTATICHAVPANLPFSALRVPLNKQVHEDYECKNNPLVGLGFVLQFLATCGCRVFDCHHWSVVVCKLLGQRFCHGGSFGIKLGTIALLRELDLIDGWSKFRPD